MKPDYRIEKWRNTQALHAEENAIYGPPIQARRPHCYAAKPISLRKKAMLVGLGALLVAATASAGCLGTDTVNIDGEVSEKVCDNGYDGIPNTEDDGLMLKVQGYGDQYRIGKDIGENFTYLNQVLEPGAYIKLRCFTGESPRKVVAINEIILRSEYQVQKAKQDAEGLEAGKIIGIGALITLGVIAGVYGTKKLLARRKRHKAD